MSNKIILVSEDLNFFEYFIQKLRLRKSDEIFRFSFEKLVSNFHLVNTSVIILNADNNFENSLEILKLINEAPCIIFSLNEIQTKKNKFLKNGAIDFITPFNTEEEINQKLNIALKISSYLDKKEHYRKFLIKGGIISENNEVYLDYKSIIESELERINSNSIPAVLVAISPNEKTKFLLQANQIETVILNQVRKNDILMNYAANKYFLLLFNINIETAQKLWENIKKQIPENIYAGFANALYKKRENLISEVLNNLHETINNSKNSLTQDENFSDLNNNFKNFRQNYEKKIKNIIIPVFYQIQQKYNKKLWDINLTEEATKDTYLLNVKSKYNRGVLRITIPGFSIINIDIEYYGKSLKNKRISYAPEEFESGVLEDIIEQFINEFKKETKNDNT